MALTCYRVYADDLTAREMTDIADALAHSVEGRVVSVSETDTSVVARIEVSRGMAARYLVTLCDDDDRVTHYGEVR